MKQKITAVHLKILGEGGKIMKKRKRKKDKNHVSFNQIVATTLIAALSITSVSLESLAAEPAQTAENQAKTEAAFGADDSVECPKE